MQAPVGLWRTSICVLFFWLALRLSKNLELLYVPSSQALGISSHISWSFLFSAPISSLFDFIPFFFFFFRCLRSSGLFVSDCCCGLATFFLLYVCVFSPPQTHLSLCVFFLFLKAPGFPVGFLFLLSGCLTSIDISTTSCTFGL